VQGQLVQFPFAVRNGLRYHCLVIHN
jgi:hypothetical protein